MLKNFFSIFQYESIVCSTELKVTKLFLGCFQSSPRCCQFLKNYECPNPFSVGDTSIFVIFSNFFRKLNLQQNNLQKLKFPTLQFRAVRVFPRAANLASKFDCSNSFCFRDLMCFIISFFFSDNLDVKKFKKT